jgi:hypothetical protein
MEALAITASECILLSSSSPFLTAISNFRVTNNRLDETAKPISLKKRMTNYG